MVVLAAASVSDNESNAFSVAFTPTATSQKPLYDGLEKLGPFSFEGRLCGHHGALVTPTGCRCYS